MDRAVLLCPPVDVIQISSIFHKDSTHHSSLSILLATETGIIPHGILSGDDAIKDVQKCQEELIVHCACFQLLTYHFRLHAVTFKTLDPGDANFLKR